jgi:ribosomal protein S18 acetylase RimI-like enzyme
LQEPSEKLELDSSLSCPNCTSSFLSTLHHLSILPTPPLRPENQKYFDLAAAATSAPDFKGRTYDEIPPVAYLTHLLTPRVVTLGTLNSVLLPALTSRNLIRDDFPGLDAPNGKFIFEVSNTPVPKPLPPGLRWGTVRAQDIEDVQAGTAIPRATETLMRFKRIAVFPDGADRPVAWAFLSHDGSLSSMHVKSEYRGQGIAKSLAAKLFRESVESTAEGEGERDDWAHADVYKGNVQSETVCRSIGGEPMWTVYWVRLDLGRVEDLFSKA